jgi:CBS-domain-containing membrane protein
MAEPLERAAGSHIARVRRVLEADGSASTKVFVGCPSDTLTDVTRCAHCPELVGWSLAGSLGDSFIKCRGNPRALPISPGTRVVAAMTDVACVRAEVGLEPLTAFYAELALEATPVLDARNGLLGMITRSEVLGESRGTEATAREVMTTVVPVSDRATIADALGLVAIRSIRHLPVVAEAHGVVGMVSALDLIRVLVRSRRLASGGAPPP